LVNFKKLKCYGVYIKNGACRIEDEKIGLIDKVSMMSRSVTFIFLKYYSFMYLVEVRERI